MEIERIGDIRCRLGEGPLWDAQEQALYWVDASAATLHRIDWSTRAAKSWHMPGPNVGSLALRENGGAVIAMGRGFYTFDFETGEASLVQELLTTDQSVRFNDGKTDRQGRFIAGSMDLDEGEGRPIGVVYQLDSELQPNTDSGRIRVLQRSVFSAPMAKRSIALAGPQPLSRRSTTIRTPARCQTAAF